ncbi:MAG: hypothetical protein HY873_11265 [Chloroflexi bacterium]|nr:hypothetical protein [Chloroflexota bacterium]
MAQGRASCGNQKVGVEFVREAGDLDAGFPFADDVHRIQAGVPKRAGGLGEAIVECGVIRRFAISCDVGQYDRARARVRETLASLQ